MSSSKTTQVLLIAVALLIATSGMVLNALHIVGNPILYRYGSVGNWCLIMAAILLAYAGISLMMKEKPGDERTRYLGAEASRITFIAFVMIAFVIILVDGIHPITLSYLVFMPYLVCGVFLTFEIAYRILERRH